MSADQGKHKDEAADPGDTVAVRRDEERPLDTWARCAPIRLAGYEDDLSETHILRSID